MELSFARCKAILKTLPIGYYCGRKIPLEMSETESTSYYSPMEDKIVISYPIICKSLEKASSDYTDEIGVRSMLYHEISHVILTPDTLMENVSSMFQQVLNIFEDERIETILNNYYLDTNFKQQVYNINGQPDATTTDPMKMFYQTVRMRFGTEELVKEVEDIIEKAKYINPTTTFWGNDINDYSIYEYRHDIRELWEKFYNASNDKLEDIKNNAKQFSNENNQSIKIDKNNIQHNQTKSTENSDDNINAENEENGELADYIKKICGEVFNKNHNLNENDIIKISNAHKEIERLISNFNKKNTHGSGYNAYSGIFNPRAINRNDYKYFERAANINGNNQFGTCHLTLWLDKSGSFYKNQDIVNSLLASLSEIERKNKNFNMDVVFMDEDLHVCKTVKERVMRCDAGNYLPETIKSTFNKMQKNNSYNYNIVLFDGDAWCATSAAQGAERFKQFDNRNTCMITDPDNEVYLKRKPFQNARVIVTKNYTNELIDNVLKALAIMFN